VKTMSTRAFTSPDADRWDIVRRYDAIMYDPSHQQYFSQSDFTNFGYWKEDIASQKAACETLMDELLKRVPEPRGRVLDVACGKGATTRYLFDRFPSGEVVGINISEKQLETARRNAPGCRFELMDAVELRFESESFDFVFCIEAAFHFDTRKRFLAEALRVLKPGGWLLLSDILVSREAERTKPYRLEANYLEGPEAYRALAREVGFERSEVEDATVPCWHGCYWNAVRYFHEQFLKSEIDQPMLEDRLRLSYRRLEEITHYLLVASVKGKRNEKHPAG
jgi:MPBQ/MSBQ methyltransferase